MNMTRPNSSPNLLPTVEQQQYDDSALQGVVAQIQLLLKLIKDHKVACGGDTNDKKRMFKVATMITVLDTVKSRIQKSQSFGNKKSELANVPRNGETTPDPEKEKLRKELNASLAAGKSLQVMCCSLGKEKEIMSSELLKKVHEVAEMDELINDLKAQNEKLLRKVKEYSSSENVVIGGGSDGNSALQDRNKLLTVQLSKSLDGFRSMRRKLKEAREENKMMRGTMDEMGAKVVTSLERVRTFKEHVSSEGSVGPSIDVQEEIVALENEFEHFQMLVAKHDQSQEERQKAPRSLPVSKP